MLKLNDLKILFPTSLEEASSLLEENPGSLLIAGGTDLLPKLRRGQFEPSVCLSMEKLRSQLTYIRTEEKDLCIGSMTTLREIEEHPSVASYVSFFQAVQKVASPTIRNSATLGGNLTQDTRCKFVDKSELWRASVGFCMKKEGDLCRVAPGSPKCLATFCSDLAPALMVLEAVVVLQKKKEKRKIALRDFYQDNGQLNLLKDPAEILVEVRIPREEGRSSRYEKFRLRGGLDFPETGVALSWEKKEKDYFCRIAFAAMSSHVPYFEKSLSITAPEEEREKWIEEIYGQIRPRDTMYSPPLYRKKVARNLLKKMLTELLDLENKK